MKFGVQQIMLGTVTKTETQALDTLKKINEDTDSLDKHGGPPDAVNERAY